MRQWRPLDAEGGEIWRAVHQIVVPRQYRNKVLHLAHGEPIGWTFGDKQNISEDTLTFLLARRDVVKFGTI